MKTVFTRLIPAARFGLYKTGFSLLLGGIATFLMSTPVYGQEDTASSKYENFSLKDLLDVKIVSASKSAEFLFDAPLSSSVVTKEEIRRTGCTSIMEALRLVPGMIVREQSNGNYDIYLRGMDNVPPDGQFEGNSTTTLVMIDSRPIYNYLKGGTFWETLPIDINDVEKIEVIRGPSAALYGPNAVNGVINIITRQTKNDGLYLLANSQQGSFNTFINNASVGYQGRKWSVIGSGNFQFRDRTQTSYYEFYRDLWLESPDYFISMMGDTIQNKTVEPEHGMKKYAGNIFFNYEPTDEMKFTLAGGAQHSLVQKVSTENSMTPLSTVFSDSRYMDLRASVKGISAQFAYISGTQLPTDQVNNYDFNTIDGTIEYNYTKGNLILKPGLSYRSAIYDDTKYADIINKTGLFNTKGKITTSTASLRSEYKMLDNKLRLVAGMAFSKFNYPDTTYMSLELAATYKLDKNHLLRAVWSQSPRSATVYDTYVDHNMKPTPIGDQKYYMISVEGNKNLELLTADMRELGYRGTLSKGIYIDVELFDIHSKNYNTSVMHGNYVKIVDQDTFFITPTIATNIPVKLRQLGATVSLTWQTPKTQIRTFMTFQRSRIKNYSVHHNLPEANGPFVTDPGINNIYSGMGVETDHKSTPRLFGGIVINYKPAEKWNINLNGYYYSSQTYSHLTNVVFGDGIRGIDHIPSKLILNASVSYEAADGVRIFTTVKNILNDSSREFFKSDNIPFSMYGGLSFEF